MNGLTLSRRYYETYGQPLLREQFPQLESRVAVGLAGMGSECFGFDDEISADHDYGPGFCLWLTEEDFAAEGARLEAAYRKLPQVFLGVGPRVSAGGDDRVGTMRSRDFYRRFIGDRQPPADALDWLRLPEQYLACAVNGAVFRDELGQFTALREALLAYYPEDVRRKKIAARLAAMAQSGQYNYSRCLRRHEPVSAAMALGRFLEAAASLAHLLCRRYTPFYKWCFRSLETLPLPPRLGACLRELALCRPAPELWPADKLRYAAELNLGDPSIRLIEEVCALCAELLREQGLSDRREDFLQTHAEAVTQGIADPRIRAIFITEG